ncbi:MAG: hypothetical protein A3I68_04015 [Candidatus Melainabacteria bacterium RIFCSPLOWO2_02_FULL_35_15]|nr:MAG: hypothetical protein A3F80_01525 [Candidatus Melainabacteria bacterium RIFCSPLOWO2_12_FULL_35_11]OGI13137.1 MAG: hypothetical protein A3I68_04015 [Candidatus Melainabacteria bacterium RIFCSPLOWO2_02_FULL_35_15]
MLKQMRGLLLILLLLCVNSITISEIKAETGTVPLSIAVNGSLVVSDGDNDTMAGKDPTKNVSLTVTPDLGHTLQSGSANFRIRSNRSAWRLTAQRTASDAGDTSIADTDVLVDIAKSAGSSANANAGALVAPFTAQTNLSSITTATTVDVITGTAKTSSARDANNTNNWFQVGTTYSIQPDFFYTPGTFSSTITYNLVSP